MRIVEISASGGSLVRESPPPSVPLHPPVVGAIGQPGMRRPIIFISDLMKGLLDGQNGFRLMLVNNLRDKVRLAQGRELDSAEIQAASKQVIGHGCGRHRELNLHGEPLKIFKEMHKTTQHSSFTAQKAACEPRMYERITGGRDDESVFPAVLSHMFPGALRGEKTSNLAEIFWANNSEMRTEPNPLRAIALIVRDAKKQHENAASLARSTQHKCVVISGCRVGVHMHRAVVHVLFQSRATTPHPPPPSLPFPLSPFHIRFPPFIDGFITGHRMKCAITGRYPAGSVTFISMNMVEADVRDPDDARRVCRIHLVFVSCSCGRPSHFDLPCEHLVMASIRAGKNPFDLVPARYSVDEWREPYAAIEAEGGFADITDEEIDDLAMPADGADVVLPPAVTPNRSGGRRKRSARERAIARAGSRARGGRGGGGGGGRGRGRGGGRS